MNELKKYSLVALRAIFHENRCSNIQEYCSSKFKPGTYLDQPEMEIIAEFFKIRIRVYYYMEKGSNKITYSDTGNKSDPLIYLFYVNKNHFQSLYPC